MFFKQGDVVIVDFGQNVGAEKNGVRPAVVMLDNVFSPNIIVVPITSLNNKMKSGRYKLNDTQVFISNYYYLHSFLKNSSVAQMEDIRSVSRERVDRKIGEVSHEILSIMQSKIKKMFIGE